MSIFRCLVTSGGFIATLTAGTIMLGVIDGASAKEYGRGSRDMAEQTNRFVNTIHPIIYDPDKSHHCHKHHHCHDKVRYLGPPVPAPTYPPKPVATAPGNAVPVKTFSAY
jgi:hypothetical protein